MPAVGQQAPDFELPDTHNTPVRLSELRGDGVLVVFFPFAFSRICHRELAELNERTEDFDGVGVHLLAISCDSVHSQRAWAAQEEFEITLLSDFWPHGHVSQAYGVFDHDAGHPGRGSVLIDADGTVAWTTFSPPGQPRSLTEQLQAARALSGVAGQGATGPDTPALGTPRAAAPAGTGGPGTPAPAETGSPGTPAPAGPGAGAGPQDDSGTSLEAG